jgi:hypothetical protein
VTIAKSNFGARSIQPSPAIVTDFVARVVLPSFQSLPLAEVLKMDLRGYQITQKLDGRTAAFGNIVGEKMRDGSFFAFDIREDLPLRERAALLGRVGCLRVPCGHGREFVEAVFANPEAEGVCLKPWDSGFCEGWIKCKRVETFDVTVTGKVQSAMEIAFEGQPAGKCALFGSNWEAVSIGDVVEIAAYRRNVSGKFREPRFIRLHPSKNL